MLRRFSPVAALLLAVVVLGPAGAQPRPAPDADEPDMTLTPAVRAEVVEAVLKHLNEKYVFPEVARKMDQSIRDRLARNEYDAVTGAKDFAKKLTEHLQAVSHDKHLRVRYSFRTVPKREQAAPTPADIEQMRKFAAARNFGFEKVERLEGNVGYIDLRGFMSADLAGDTAAAAFAFLAHTDALVLDLRNNGGGDPAMVALLCSYLFPGTEVVHLNDLYFRPQNETHQWWTLPYVPGKRYTDRPVYVLTSAHTFSAAEECTYNLKNLKRATIVGETTGGGAHPGGTERLGEHFMAFIPMGRAINPVSKTNWEGTGVSPDVTTTAALALKTAHLAALKKSAEKHGDDPERGRQLKRTIRALEKELEDLKVKDKTAAGPGR